MDGTRSSRRHRRTKTQAKIPDRVYPRDLHGIPGGLSDDKPFFRGPPVADPRRVLIAVEQSGGRLQIYGLVDIGMALWEMARHERVMGNASPETLVVMSTRPDELSISRGDRPVLRMRDGGIVAAAQSVLLKGQSLSFRCGVRGIHP